MPNASDRAQWAAQDREIERIGFVDWQSRQVADEEIPYSDALRGVPREQAADVLRALMTFCLPPKSFGARRFRSGYFRMVAVAWRLNPVLLEPCRTDQDVAARLGISRKAFEKHLDKVDALLTRRAACKKHPVKIAPGGSSRGGVAR